jgi:hypothetical protein
MVSCGLLAGTRAMAEAPAAPSEQEADVAAAPAVVAPSDLPDVGVAVVPNLFERAGTVAINPKNASQLVAGIAMCGRLSVGKGFLGVLAVLVGAAMCPAS